MPDVQHAACTCHQGQDLLVFLFLLFPAVNVQLRSKGKRYVRSVKGNHFEFSYTDCFA